MLEIDFWCLRRTCHKWKGRRIFGKQKAASESTINILHICIKDLRFNMNMLKGSRNFDICVHFLGPRVSLNHL